MALAAVVRPGIAASGALKTQGASKSDWFTFHDNLLATASDATVLKQPLTAAVTTCHPAKVPAGATRLLVRVAYSIATTVVGTSPAIKLYSIFSEPTLTLGLPSWANDGTVNAMRIDAATNVAASTPITCTLATDQSDAAFFYSDPISLTAIDALNGSYILPLVGTAGAITTGTVMKLLGMFLD